MSHMPCSLSGGYRRCKSRLRRHLAGSQKWTPKRRRAISRTASLRVLLSTGQGRCGCLRPSTVSRHLPANGRSLRCPICRRGALSSRTCLPSLSGRRRTAHKAGGQRGMLPPRSRKAGAPSFWQMFSSSRFQHSTNRLFSCSPKFAGAKDAATAADIAVALAKR